MQLIRKQAYARAGLVGNPSDGYHGKTISAVLRNFAAEVVLYEWDQLELMWSDQDRCRFRSIHDLIDDVQLHGYYGGIRLIKATIKRFAEFCAATGRKLHDRTFSVRYESTIPRQVGLAGSSAIIVAALRCLMEFYGVEIPRDVQPSLVLSVETEELGLAAGLQDRVIQVYEGVVFMDFAKERMEQKHGLLCGVYEPLDPAMLPPLYLAYSTERSKPIQTTHNDLRTRYRRGDPEVIGAMEQFAQFTVEARRSLLAGDVAEFGRLIDANYDLRRSICTIPPMHADMVARARSVGVSAGFSGSGGAVVGVCPDEATFARLQAAFEPLRCRVIRPQIPPHNAAEA